MIIIKYISAPAQSIINELIKIAEENRKIYGNISVDEFEKRMEIVSRIWGERTSRRFHILKTARIFDKNYILICINIKKFLNLYINKLYEFNECEEIIALDFKLTKDEFNDMCEILPYPDSNILNYKQVFDNLCSKNVFNTVDILKNINPNIKVL